MKTGFLIEVSEFYRVPSLILMDLEFTCWEDSLKGNWSDQTRPPEVLEIGLAAYDTRTEQLLDTFSSLVRPRLHSQLSQHCANLLHIAQAEIDQAPTLIDVVDRIIKWESKIGIPQAATASWGIEDRLYLTEDTLRADCVEPFMNRPHLDLMPVACSLLGLPMESCVERDEIRKILKLPPIANRHRGLADALDLVGFYQALKRIATT